MATNQLVDDSKKAEAAAAAPPSDATLRAELEAERKARASAEGEAQYFRGAAQAEWNRANAATQRPAVRGEDPFAKLATEGVTLDPEKQAELLDAGSRGRAREEANRVGQEVDLRAQQREAELEKRLALKMFMSSHPEVTADEEGFIAAMARANVRNNQQRLNLDPMGMLQLGLQCFNEGRAPAASAPYTEGASSGGAGGPMKKPDEPAPLSMAEEVYGATDFVDERKVPLDDYTQTYLDNRNMELVNGEKFWSGIRNVVSEIRGAKGRAAARR
jgi:hypothetical protein